MESGHSDIGDVMERGHGRVAGQNAHIVPPLGLHSLPLKRKVRMVSLRLTGRKKVIGGNHVHHHGAVNEATGGVDGTEAQRPGLGLPTVCVAMIPKRLSSVSRAGMSRTARNPGRATCNS